MFETGEGDSRAISVVGALVKQGLAHNRWHAQQLVTEGYVYFKKHRIESIGEMVSSSVPLHVRKTYRAFEPRDSSNLQYGLERFRFSPHSRVCAVLGKEAGCTKTLIESGARRVFSVGVKSRQEEDKDYDSETRVTSVEVLRLRHLNHGVLPLPLAGIVVNSRTMRLDQILPVMQGFAIPGCWMLAFVHLHIEAPKETKEGRQIDLLREVAQRIRTIIESQDDWHAKGAVVAPVRERLDASNMLMIAAEHSRRTS